MYNFIRATLGFDPPVGENYPTQENRFHMWDNSPSQDIRTRAAFIRARGKCPVTAKNINFACPKCGIPTHHSEEAWKMDTDHHENKCAKLRAVNTYEHDLRSGRDFPEFDFPENQDPEAAVNFRDWDSFFYTRQFYSMDTEFHLAAVTKMLSYPLTMASIIHPYSPYGLKPKGPLSLEGLKSLAALRYTMFPTDKSRITERPVRVFVLGARAEAQMPPHAWKQLSYLLPHTPLEVIFVGPEALYDRTKRRYVASAKRVTKRLDPKLAFTYCTDYFHVPHEARDFAPYDPYMDVFFLFHPGLGAPEAMDQWEKTVPGLLESKCAVFVTGFHKQDVARDWQWLHSKFGDELDVLLEPEENVFGSTKWELNDLDPSEVYQFNQQLFGFRGKRYHAIRR